MKYFLVGVIFALTCACATAPKAVTGAHQDQAFLRTETACHPKEMSYREAVVKLDTLTGSTASGVVISPGRIITVAHAVDDETPIYAEINGVLVESKVVAINRSADLAYLAVDTMDIKPIEIASALPEKGEAVWAAGFPLASSQRISTGFFEQVSDGRLYTSVHINSGTSGGGLLRCENGNVRLAGVVHGFVALKRNGSLINIGDSTSVSAREIREFVQSASNIKLVELQLDKFES